MVKQWIQDNVKGLGYKWPLKKREVASVLGISLTKFHQLLKDHPHFHKVGYHFRFSPSDVQKIWDGLAAKKVPPKTKLPSLPSEGRAMAALRKRMADKKRQRHL